MLVFSSTSGTYPLRNMLCLDPQDCLHTYTTFPYSRNDAGRVRTDKSRLGLSLEYGMDLGIQVSVDDGQVQSSPLCEELTLSMS